MPVKIEKDNSISISGFKGIGQSPLDDFSDVMGINLERQGLAGVNFKFNKIAETISATTSTVDAAGVTSNIITTADSLWYRENVKGLAVTLSTTGTLPGGLSEDTIYYVINVGTTTGLYRLATSLENASAGTAIDITDTGTGTHTITPITPKKIIGWTNNPSGDIFAIDVDRDGTYSNLWFIGSVPYLLKGNLNNCSGIMYFKGYILVWDSNGVSALTDIQAYDNTLTWTADFDDIAISNTGDAMPFFSVNDGNRIYFYNGLETGRYYKIGFLEEVVGQTFNPKNSATFDFVADAITIPFESFESQPVDIDEINEYIVIASGTDKLYFWDKKSPSFTSYIKLQESGIKSIEIVDNTAYVFMKNSGNIYQANTVSSELFLSVPDHISNEYYNYIAGVENYRTNYTFLFKRELLFSVSIISGDTYRGYSKNYIMSYNFDREQLTKKYISSYGETNERSGNDFGYIYSIYNRGDNLLLSSSDYTISGDTLNYAVESQLYNDDYLGTKTKYVYDNYEPYIITGLLSYGENYNKKTVRELQVSFIRELATGQGIKVYYRRNDNGSWTLLKTIDYTTYGGIKDLKVEAPITDIIDIQFKIEMTGLNKTSPYLKYIRLIP